MPQYARVLPMPSRRQQLGRKGRENLMAALKFMGKLLLVAGAAYIFFVLAFSFGG